MLIYFQVLHVHWSYQIAEMAFRLLIIKVEVSCTVSRTVVLSMAKHNANRKTSLGVYGYFLEQHEFDSLFLFDLSFCLCKIETGNH